MRYRSKRWRVRRLRDLPEDDGLVPAMLDGRQVFVDPEVLRPAFEAKMAAHDAASAFERHGHNQWGAGWLHNPGARWRFEYEAPLLQTDLNYHDYEKRVTAMAKLDAKERKALPKKDFAVPSRGEGKARRGGYPIPDESHARNALARASQHGTPKVKAEVKRAVERKFPNIKVAGKEKR